MIKQFIQLKSESIIFLLFIVAYFGLRCFYLDTSPRWDSASYWVALSEAVKATQEATNLNDLYQAVLNKYNAFGHPSMGYYSILVAFQLIDFPNQYLLNLANILLSIITIFCFFKTLKWFFPSNTHKTEVLLTTICFAFNPLFFGASIFLNTDFPVLVFFTLATVCILYGHYGLFAIASIFMIFSKETGSLYWASILLGIGVYGIINAGKNLYAHSGFRFSSLFPDNHQNFPNPIPTKAILYRIFCLLLPGLTLIAYFIARQGSMWQMDGGLTFNSSGWNSFGFNKRVILNRTGEIFLLNFHWLFSLLIIIFLFVGIGRRIESRKNSDTNFFKLESNKKWGIYPIAFSFLIFVGFNISYITFIIPRYVIAAGFFLIVLLFFAMLFCIHSAKKRQYVLAVLTLLCFAQTFRTIDPVSKIAFGSASFSNHNILQIDSPGEAVGNGFVYNSEFTMIDKLFNRMQQSMPMSADTTLIAWNRDAWYPWFDFGTAWVDAKSLKRTIDWRNGFKYRVINIDDLPSANRPSDAFYIYMPWLSKFSNEQDELNLVANYYQIGAMTEINHRGYKLRYYKLTIK